MDGGPKRLTTLFKISELIERGARWGKQHNGRLACRARIGPGGEVSEVAEKVQISENALTGLYHFTDAADFFSIAAEAVAGGQPGELYVAPMYNKLIAAGRRFVLDEARCITPLGTPEDVERLAADGE